MAKNGGDSFAAKARGALMRREMAVFLPAVGLAGLWFGADAMALLAATAIAVAWLTRPLAPATEATPTPAQDIATGLPLRPEAIAMMDAVLRKASASSRGTACLVVGLDEPEVLARQISRQEFDEVMRRTAERLRGALRESDRVARLEGACFAIVLNPTPRPDLESMIQLSVRLQNAIEVPLSVSARTIGCTAYVGFCLMNRSPELTGEAILTAAEAAADEARRNGPSAIRAYSTEVQAAVQTRSHLTSEVGNALENGQILAFFQPQLCTTTGQVSGMQAVPRWLHRERGVLTEAEILPAVDAAGLRQRLAEVMLFQCFHAMREWDRRKEVLGPVALPVSHELMRNPKMAERLKWEIDRFDVAPERLRLVLQQAVASHLEEDVVALNLSACAAMGCDIELAGFGNGPASVNSVRRSCAKRLRIHRSFVARVDRDPEQQRLVAAIISLAEGLGVDTIAEGVGTIGEHAMLSQLGCGHVQGKAIAAPMPLEETFGWAERHRAKLEATPRIGRSKP